jgi:hypothetical protein
MVLQDRHDLKLELSDCVRAALAEALHSIA